MRHDRVQSTDFYVANSVLGFAQRNKIANKNCNKYLKNTYTCIRILDFPASFFPLMSILLVQIALT